VRRKEGRTLCRKRGHKPEGVKGDRAIFRVRLGKHFSLELERGGRVSSSNKIVAERGGENFFEDRENKTKMRLNASPLQKNDALRGGYRNLVVQKKKMLPGQFRPIAVRKGRRREGPLFINKRLVFNSRGNDPLFM